MVGSLRIPRLDFTVGTYQPSWVEIGILVGSFGLFAFLYFLFIHYTVSFHKQIPPPDWFRYWFLAMVGVVAILHVAAFVRMVRISRADARALA